MIVSLLHQIRRSKGFSGIITVILSIAILSAPIIQAENAAEQIKRISLTPTTQHSLPKLQPASVKKITNSERLSETVLTVQDTLDYLSTPCSKANRKKAHQRLQKLCQKLIELDKQAMAEFAQVQQHIDQHKLSLDVIQQRQDQAIAQYRQGMAKLLQQLRSLENEPNIDKRQAILKETRTFLKSKQLKRSQQQFDPNNLPFKSMQPNPDNKPKLTPGDFSGAGLFSNPQVQLAALGDFNFSNLLGASNPAYLAETAEVTLTDAIRDQAEALDHHTVKIYHWVRNNIEWIPSWGAMQSADITLGSRRGNAFDIASLIIALLRASQIPARYVHGTIEVPEAKFRNWAGGFESIDAAANYAASGGIPITAVDEGGVTTKVRLEHIWVEAATDYHPSRGAKNRGADTWLALDPTFKQTGNLNEPDVLQITGINPEETVKEFIEASQIDEQTSSIISIDNEFIEKTFLFAPEIIEEFKNENLSFLSEHYSSVENIGLTNFSSGRKIIDTNNGVLASSLPYEIFIKGLTYGHLPDSLITKVTFNMGINELGQLSEPVTLSLPQLNNQELTIGFSFSTPTDHDTYVAFLPDASVDSLDDLPSSIPSFLIDMVPELHLNENLVAKGKPIKLGESFKFKYNLHFPFNGINTSETHDIPAGAYLGLGVIAGSINTKVFTKISNDMSGLGAALDSNSTDNILSLAPNFQNRVLANIYHAGLIDYFGRLIMMSDLIARGTNFGNAHLLMGIGLFGYIPKVNYFFGFPRSVSIGSIQMDIATNLHIAQSNDNDPNKKRILLNQIGIISSALEGNIPNSIFGFDEHRGGSAVNNIEDALEQGQKVYRITNQNSDLIGILNLPKTVVSDINVAINNNLEVFVHERPIHVVGRNDGISSLGYIIRDPIVGTGEYLIDNGTNGGLHDLADGLLEDCARVNRPGFVDNDLDWERWKITRKCADLARDLKTQSFLNKFNFIKRKIDAAKAFHDFYAKAPLVIVRCMMIGAPTEFTQLLGALRASALMLTVVTAMQTVPVAIDMAGRIASFYTNLLKFAESACPPF